MTNITVTLPTGEKLDVETDSFTLRQWTRMREVPCPDVPPCNAVHRKLVGPERLTIRAAIAKGGW